MRGASLLVALAASGFAAALPPPVSRGESADLVGEGHAVGKREGQGTQVPSAVAPSPTPTTIVTSFAAVATPSSTAPHSNSGSGSESSSNMGNLVTILIPVFFGVIVLAFVVYFMGWGAGRKAWDSRHGQPRLANMSQSGGSSASLNSNDRDALARSAAAADAATNPNRRGRRRRGSWPPRRTESGRSVRTLPRYTTEAGDEEVVLLQRERSERSLRGGTLDGHTRNLSLATLDEGAESHDDRYSVDLGRRVSAAPSAAPGTGADDLAAGAPPSYIHAPPYELDALDAEGRDITTATQSQETHRRRRNSAASTASADIALRLLDILDQDQPQPMPSPQPSAANLRTDLSSTEHRGSEDHGDEAQQRLLAP